MIQRLSLASRLALLFAACTAVVSLLAGVLFNRASEAHFVELDQQLLESKLVALRSTLQGVDSPQLFAQREAQLRAELNRQPDLAVRITAAGQRWFDGAPAIALPVGLAVQCRLPSSCHSPKFVNKLLNFSRTQSYAGHSNII